MKKVFSAALSVQVLVFALMVPGLCADARREFISKTMNSDIQKLLENCGREIIGATIFKQK